MKTLIVFFALAIPVFERSLPRQDLWKAIGFLEGTREAKTTKVMAQQQQPRPEGLEIVSRMDRSNAARYFTKLMPPSTRSVEPVIYDASSDTKNATAFAISSGRPSRPKGSFAPSSLS
jgi:hypothetical protein